MATDALNVSLKASTLPYGLIAQATFASIETSFLDTAEHEITLSHNGKLLTDPDEITSVLADRPSTAQGSSKVFIFHPTPILHADRSRARRF